MFFTFLYILSSSTTRLQKCSTKNYMVKATNANYKQFFGKSKPLFVRFYKANCIYTPASQAYWDEASRLLPNVQFVSAECEKDATTFCSEAKQISPIDVYPKWRVYPPNQTTHVAQFSDNNNIHSSSEYFTDVAAKYAGYIPFDNPMIETLIPQSTNRFYKLYKYPVFLLYDSNCEEDISFVNQFYDQLNKNEMTTSDYGFAKLDCSKYPDECDKWGSQIPSANVFSRSKGISVIIKEANHFSSQIKDAILQLDTNNLACPTPQPASTPTPVPTPDFSGYTVIKNTALENRDVNDIQSRYIVATTKTYQGSCCTVQCGDDLKGGNANSCKNYDLQPETIPDVLRQLNFYRELAGVPHAVTNDETLNSGCYLAAQYLSAKQQLAHDIISEKDRNKCGQWNSNWDLIRSTLQQSNLAQGDVALPPLNMINGLMDDLGVNNEKELGHRRWFLYPYLETIGFGFYPLALSPYGNYFTQTKETGVFRVSHNKAVNTDYPGIPFIAWPAPGPFPTARLPESFSLTYSGFAGVDVSEIKVSMTRDDGEVLNYESIYLDYKAENSCLSYCLIWKLSYASQQLCASTHKVNVRVVIEKTKKIIDYTIEFFDNKAQDVSCFYAADKSKCPANLAASRMFGPGQYSNWQPSSGVSRSIISVAEDVKLDSELKLNFASVIISGARISGKIVVGTTTALDIADPTSSDIVVQCNPTGNKVATGSISTTLQPKSLKVEFTAMPSYTEKPGKGLIYSGSYVEFDYPKEVQTTDYIFHFSIYYTGTKGYLMAIPIQTSKNLCYKTQILPNCEVFNDFSEIKNFVSPVHKIVKLYINQPNINISTKGWDSNVYANTKYILYDNLNFQLEYAPSLTTRVREIFIEPASAKNTLSSTLEITTSPLYPKPYFNQEIFEKRYPFSNLFLSRYTENSKQYQIPDLMGDPTAKDVLSYAEQKVFDESKTAFTNKGSYQYTDDYAYPLFVTDGVYATYTFTTSNGEARMRVQPSEQSKYASITLDFPSQATNFASIFVMDYYYVTIKASADLLSKIRLVNVKQAKFVESKGGAVSGISTDVIGNQTVDWSSSPSQVSFERLNFRTDTIAKLANTQCANAYVYDANPVIEGLKLTNLQIIRANPTLKNCQVNGAVSIELTDNTLPAIQLTGESTAFNPSSITIRASSAVDGLSLFLVGLTSAQASSLASKVTIENNEDNKYKVVASKDKKALYLANADFDENEAPEVAEATNNFLINEYRKVSETFTVNPPPPGFEYTDSIIDPLDEPPFTPGEKPKTPTAKPSTPTVKPQTPTEKPPGPSTPTTKPQTQTAPTEKPPGPSTPTEKPAPSTPTEKPQTPGPAPTDDFAVIDPPKVDTVTMPEDIIDKSTSGEVKVDTSSMKDEPDSSKRYEIKHEADTHKYVIKNQQNVDIQLTVDEGSSVIEVSLENKDTSLVIRGNSGASLQLTNSDHVDVVGTGKFELNSQNDEPVTINKFIPEEAATLSTEKDLTVKEMQIFHDVVVDVDDSKNANYNVQTVKIEQGATFKPKNLKISSVEIGLGSMLGYYDTDFTNTDFTLYYNVAQQSKSHPIDFNDPVNIATPPKSLVVNLKNWGTTLSETRFVLAQKDFSGQNVPYTKAQVEEICASWASKFVANEATFKSLQYEVTETESGKLGKVTLYCSNEVADQDPGNQGSGKKKFPIGAIIGIAVGAVVVIVTVVVVVVLIVRRKRAHESSTDAANLPPAESAQQTDAANSTPANNEDKENVAL